MNQLSLLEGVSDRLHWLKGEIAFSLSFDQDKTLKDIMRLYLQGAPFDLDPTFSTGAMWKRLPQPRLKYDLVVQKPDVTQADARSLPLEDDSVESILFDPPFMGSHIPNNPGKIKSRFTSFASINEMWQMYHDSMKEFYRILKPGGVLVVKCQDAVSSGKNWFSHYEVETYGRNLGYDQVDLFILGSKHVMISSTWKVQFHARKNHSYFIVFKRPVEKKQRR